MMHRLHLSVYILCAIGTITVNSAFPSIRRMRLRQKGRTLPKRQLLFHNRNNPRCPQNHELHHRRLDTRIRGSSALHLGLRAQEVSALLLRESEAHTPNPDLTNPNVFLIFHH